VKTLKRIMDAVAVVAGLLAIAISVIVLVSAPAAHAAGAGHRAPVSCNHAAGPFHESGNVIYQATGAPFIPYGVTVSGLERQDWASFTAADDAQITAAATAWCANTIRLQVSEHYLATDPALLPELQAEVALAESLNLVVAINANGQWDPGRPAMPTEETKTFWRTVAPLYAGDPQVIFDAFNEPRIGVTNWDCWRNGGSACTDISDVGFNSITGIIRYHAPASLIWADCPHQGVSCAGLENNLLDTAGPLAYSVHHPQGPHDAANWQAQFGYLVTGHLAAIVIGEWTNWAAARGECWTDAPTTAGPFLGYLSSLHLGLTVWSLQSGVLAGPDPAVPTAGFGPDWACVNGLGESAGQLIQARYIKWNGS
jgi:hypothetical protein